MPLRFFATAKTNGADALELRGRHGPDRAAGHGDRAPRCATSSRAREARIDADIVVNATGPWSEQVARMAGVDVPIQPSPGVMLAVRGRLCNMVMNRLHTSGDGDIVVPQRALSVVGTSSWTVEDPDDLERSRGPRAADDRGGLEADPRGAPGDLPRGVVGRPPADRVEGGRRLRPRAVADLQDDRPRRRRRRRGVRHDHRRQGHDAARAWPRSAPTSSAASSASTQPAARARPCCSPTRRVHAGGRSHERRDHRRRAGSACSGTSAATTTHRYDEFDVPVGPSARTVLEALRWIQLHDDPTLALRHSCFHASCGTCGVRVNGREGLACVTTLADVSGDASRSSRSRTSRC